MSEIETRTKIIIAGLTAALGDKNAKVRSCVVMALGKAGAWGKSAVPALSKSLEDPDKWVRTYAADTLIKIDRNQE